MPVVDINLNYSFNLFLGVQLEIEVDFKIVSLLFLVHIIYWAKYIFRQFGWVVLAARANFRPRVVGLYMETDIQ